MIKLFDCYLNISRFCIKCLMQKALCLVFVQAVRSKYVKRSYQASV